MAARFRVAKSDLGLSMTRAKIFRRRSTMARARPTVCAAVLATSLLPHTLSAQENRDGAPYRIIPKGSVITYDGWRCTVERSEGLVTVCRDGDRYARFYGGFALFGKLDTRRYGGAIASMSCDHAPSLMQVTEHTLDKGEFQRINKFWPLRVGKRARFNLRHGPRASQIIDVELSVSHRERIRIGGAARDVLVVKGRSGYVDCPNNRRNNYVSDVGGPIYVEQTWWYEPKTGLIVKYNAHWPHSYGRAEAYELVSASFPAPPKVLPPPYDGLRPPTTNDAKSAPTKAAAATTPPRRSNTRSTPRLNSRPGGAQVAQARPRTPSAPPQLAQNLRRAGSGTGFVVSRSGHIVTNDHLVSQCREMRVPAAAKIGSAATVIARDQINDLALLKVNGSPKQVATFRDGRSVRIGEDIVVYGFPLRGLLASSGNLTVGIVSALSGIRGDTRHLQITAPVQAGNSGGPLLDRSGNVVGVVVAKLNAVSVAMVTGDIPQNINFAIKRGMVESFLDVHHVPYETRPSKTSLKVVEVSDRAAKITVVVECWK